MQANYSKRIIIRSAKLLIKKTRTRANHLVKYKNKMVETIVAMENNLFISIHFNLLEGLNTIAGHLWLSVIKNNL